MHLRLHSVLAGEWGFEPRQPGSSVLGLKLFGLGPEVNCPVQKYSWGRGVFGRGGGLVPSRELEMQIQGLGVGTSLG